MSISTENQTNRPHGKEDRRIVEITGADVLTDVLNGLGLQSRLFCRTELSAPWGMSFPPSALAHFHWMERGGAWLHHAAPASGPLALAAGDLVVLPHGDPYHLSDQPNGPALPIAELLPSSGRCRVLSHGGGGPRTSMLCGSFSFLREGFPLLGLLPPVLQIRGAGFEPILQSLALEAAATRPGWETVMSRLMDVLFVQVIRAWLERQPADSHWLAALNDRHIHQALALMHERPERPWSLDTLSRSVGLSRSPFAARFTRFVGEPPLAYLARLRIQRAARALRERKVPLLEAAQIAGYTSEIAFGKAFKRIMGISPGAYRTAA